MPLHYENLDEWTRQFILEELQSDASEGVLYMSPRLNPSGQQDFERLLTEAVGEHDDAWLAEQLRYGDYFNSTLQRHNQRGTTTQRMPSSAPDTLAEGELNRFYIRGVCRLALEDGIEEVEVYRGKVSSRPRLESEAMIGRRLPANVLLEDLRLSTGAEPALGFPGPNSGLTVRLP